MRSRFISLAAAAVVVGSAAAWGLRPIAHVEVSTAEVDKGTIARRIFATGALQATRTVDVGTQVSGIVESLAADFNSIVRADQVIARLDPSLFDAALEQAKAALLQAQANSNQARAGLDGERTVEEDARTKYNRAIALSRDQLITQSDLDAAKIVEDEAIAGVHSADAAVADAAAEVQQAVASVNQAQVNRDHTIIHSPINGIVLSRNVDVGQTVAGSRSGAGSLHDRDRPDASAGSARRRPGRRR
jgi:HlyD family secretion protein